MASRSASQPALGRTLVTGAHGFIGQYVVRLLVDAGVPVLCPYLSKEESLPGLPGEHLRLDLMDPVATSEALSGVDTVIHLAARAGGIRVQETAHAAIFRINRALTDNVLEGARRAGVRRVYLSSSAVVYDEGPNRPLPESARLVGSEHPQGYAWSKVCDEVVGRWYRESGAFEVVVGRFSNVYGPGAPIGAENSTVVHDLILKAIEAGPAGELEVWGDGSAVRSFIYVEDAARGLITVAAGGVDGEAYNIDSGQEASIGALAETIRDAVDPSIRLRFDKRRPTGSPFRTLDVSKIRALGFRPSVRLAPGIEATVRAIAAARSA